MKYTTVLHTGNPAPFLYTPTSLLPEHSVLTDVRQATERNGQQWITCKSGGDRTRPEILMGSEEVVLSNSTNNSTTIGLTLQRPNGLYHCLTAQSQREYFSLFLSNAGKHQPYDSYQMSHCMMPSQSFIYTTEHVQAQTMHELYSNTYLTTRCSVLQSPWQYPL